MHAFRSEKGTLISAWHLAYRLKARRYGTGWVAKCPAHDDRSPSLSINEGRQVSIVVQCHAGCSQREVISALQFMGLWEIPKGKIDLDNYRRPRTQEDSFEPVSRTAAYAASIWESAAPAQGTLVETYLHSRGLRLPPASGLRFHSGLVHPCGETWPAMVARVVCGITGRPTGLHRTYLARNGIGKASVETPKLMLGKCAGGAARLGEAEETLLVGEGIETCLAVMDACGLPAWAGLSAAGVKALLLPEHVRTVVVLADRDSVGEQVAKQCEEKWKAEGRRVEIAFPTGGKDFNDMLLAPKAMGQPSSSK